MESSLPESLTSTPLAPVAFVGLDAPTGRHASIWQAFTAERSPDRVPLKVRSSTLFYQFSKPLLYNSNSKLEVCPCYL